MIGNELGLGVAGGCIGLLLALKIQTTKSINAFFEQMLVKADD
jgi:hypothetical protein